MQQSKEIIILANSDDYLVLKKIYLCFLLLNFDNNLSRQINLEWENGHWTEKAEVKARLQYLSTTWLIPDS